MNIVTAAGTMLMLLAQAEGTFDDAHMPAGFWRLLEAEECPLSLPAEIIKAPNARNGKAVALSNSDLSSAGSNDVAVLEIEVARGKRGALSVPIDLDSPKTLSVWCRANWHCYCGRSLNVIPPGSHNRTGTSASPPTSAAVSSVVEPGVWHWILLGRFDFEQGSQSVRCIQGGHASLLDAFLFVEDENYSPAVSSDHLRELRMREVPEESWLSMTDGTCAYLAPDVKGRAILFETAVFTPQTEKTGSIPGAIWLENSTNADQGYCLSLTRVDASTVSVKLMESGNGKLDTLSEGRCGDAASDWSSIELLLVENRLNVSVNSEPKIACKTIVPSAYTVTLRSSRGGGRAFRCLYGKEIRHYKELFGSTTTPWKTSGATWTVVNDAAGSLLQEALLVSGPVKSLLLCPWRGDECYSFVVDQHVVLPGYMGIAFDVQGPDDYRGVVVEYPQDESQPPSLKGIEVRNGQIEELAATPLTGLARESWHKLEVEVVPSSVIARVNSGGPLRLPRSHESKATQMGLVGGENGCAMIASVEAWANSAARRWDYLFEPDRAERLLAHWKIRSGKTSFHPHPSRLQLWSDTSDNEAAIEYRRPVQTNTVVTLVLPPAIDDMFNTLDMSLDLPADALVALPTDPEIAVELRSQRKCVALSVDTRLMSRIRLIEDAESLADETIRRPIRSGPRTISLGIGEESIRVEVEGAYQRTLPVPSLGRDDAGYVLSIQARQFDGENPIEISRILIDETGAGGD